MKFSSIVYRFWEDFEENLEKFSRRILEIDFDEVMNSLKNFKQILEL